MKRRIGIILAGMLILTACGNSETTSEPETLKSSAEIMESRAEENDIKLPYKFETDDGNIVLENIYIWQQDDTIRGGYKGYVILEFDFPDMTDDERSAWCSKYGVHATISTRGANKLTVLPDEHSDRSLWHGIKYFILNVSTTDDPFVVDILK